MLPHQCRQAQPNWNELLRRRQKQPQLPWALRSQQQAQRRPEQSVLLLRHLTWAYLWGLSNSAVNGRTKETSLHSKRRHLRSQMQGYKFVCLECLNVSIPNAASLIPASDSNTFINYTNHTLDQNVFIADMSHVFFKQFGQIVLVANPMIFQSKT